MKDPFKFTNLLARIQKQAKEECVKILRKSGTIEQASNDYINDFSQIFENEDGNFLRIIGYKLEKDAFLQIKAVYVKNSKPYNRGRWFNFDEIDENFDIMYEKLLSFVPLR